MKKGQSVTLATARPIYGCGFHTPDGRLYAPAGSSGNITVVDVPAVTGRERTFVCVDLPADTPLVDHGGRPAEYPPGRVRPDTYRVACYPHEIA